MRKTFIALMLSVLALMPAPTVSAQSTVINSTRGVVQLLGQVGRMISRARTTTDNATQNTWNVVSQSLNANVLNQDGRTLEFVVGLLGANNANTHEYQAYFSASSATCGGTGAAMCDTGCIVLPSVTNTTAFNGEVLRVFITRTSSGNQDYIRALAGGANIAQTVGTCSIADSGATKLVFGTRNTSAAAASLAQVTSLVLIY